MVTAATRCFVPLLGLFFLRSKSTCVQQMGAPMVAGCFSRWLQCIMASPTTTVKLMVAVVRGARRRPNLHIALTGCRDRRVAWLDDVLSRIRLIIILRSVFLA
jgi:hypothetical protein